MAENTTTLIKFLGEEGTQAFVENVKDLLSNKANVSHTHTAEDVGADTKGSASAALALANQYTDEQIATITTGDVVVKESEHASTADKATNADSATNSENAEKATKDSAGNIITDTYETKDDSNAKLEEAKLYTDSAASTVKNDLLNGAGAAYDTLKELGDLIDENNNAIDALETVASGKADKEHNHDNYALKTDVENINTVKDWNQNDETADDYIKNRTHWTEYEREELIADVTVTFTNGEGEYETDIILIEGEEYFVTYKGVEYKCIAKKFSLSTNLYFIYIGNDVEFGGTDNSKPFCMGTTSNTEGILGVVDFESASSATFSLTHLITKSVHQLDQKYIPNSDWDAKEGETGHVLNRTHYMDITEVLPETTYTGVSDTIELSEKLGLEVGKTYIVNYNGVEKEYVCSILEGTVYIGDLALGGSDEFTILDIPDSESANLSHKSQIAVKSGVIEVTVSVRCINEYKKLDNKFLDLDWLPITVDGEEVLLETSITFNNSDRVPFNGLTNDMVVLGNNYIVNLLSVGGEKYSRICELKEYSIDSNSIYYLGNYSLIDSAEENTGEEFLIAIATTNELKTSLGGDAIMIIPGSYTIIVTLSIAESVKVPNKLPNEFLDVDWYASSICVEEEIFPEFVISDAFNIGLTPDMIEVGGTYAVYINGEKYETVAKSCEYYDGSYFTVTYLGNGAILNNLDGDGLGSTTEQPDTGENYCVMIIENMSSLIMNDIAVVDINLSISKITKYINKLPNKYLDLAWLPVMKPSEELFYEKTTGSGGMTSATNFDWSLLEVNESVVVYYNDERYETKVYIAEGIKYIGSLTYNSDELSEPFVIKNINGTALFETRDSNTTLKVYKLSAENLVPNKIPTEFLPDNIGGDAAFYVTVTANEDGSFTADKTFAEITEAYEAVKSLYCKVVMGESSSFLPLATMSDTNIMFAQAGTTFVVLEIHNDNSVQIEMTDLATKNEIPTTTSALTNDSGFITKAVSDLTNYYLKSEVDTKLSTVPKFAFSIVNELPTENISTSTVYLVPNNNSVDNLYTEYIYVDGEWKVKGTQSLDLSGVILAPANVTTGSLLMFDGTTWVSLTKDELIADIIAAIPSVEGVKF